MAPVSRSFVLVATALLLSCASTPPFPAPEMVPSPPQWTFERDAIRLRLVADQQLNLFNKAPHALVSCLYQLRDPNAFNQAAGEPDGIARLLECGRFDPTVAGARRLVIQPRQELEERIDRAEGARYLGYVAGYYGARSENSIYLVEVPVTRQTDGRGSVLKPASATLALKLGPTGLVPAGRVE